MGAAGKTWNKIRRCPHLLQNSPRAEIHVKPATNSHFSAFARDGRDELSVALGPWHVFACGLPPNLTFKRCLKNYKEFDSCYTLN